MFILCYFPFIFSLKQFYKYILYIKKKEKGKNRNLLLIYLFSLCSIIFKDCETEWQII